MLYSIKTVGFKKALCSFVVCVVNCIFAACITMFRVFYDGRKNCFYRICAVA